MHNAGVPGYSSHQVRLAAERWIPALRPAGVVICVGNNDAWPARRSDAEQAAGGIGGAVVGVLRHSAFLTLAARLLRGDQTPENPIYFADDAVPRVGDDDMAANLDAVFELARARGARPVLLGAPAILESPPRNIDATIARYKQLGDRVYAEIQAGNAETAMALADEALAQDEANVYLLWLRAMVTALAVDRDRGHEELEAVFERHHFPDRARRSYRQRQRDVARAAGVPFVDVNALFRDGRSADATRALYLDWCHPTASGHRIVAERLARVLLE